MKTHLILVLVLSGGIISCHGQKRIPDGGSCSYEHTDYPAVLLDTFSYPNQVYDLMIYRGGYIKDTVFYSHINNGRLVNTTLRDLHLNLGDTVCYRVSQITEGVCSPWVDRILLEKYTGSQ